MAHNNESIEALIETIRNYYHRDKLDVLFAATKGKPITSMVDQLKEITDTFYVTDFDFHKALDKQTIFDEIKVDDKVLVDDCVRFIENYEGKAC